jgi:arabinan endo-1,5-alpha-L-arabinosidase
MTARERIVRALRAAFVGLVLCWVAGLAAGEVSRQPALTGELGIHDPSIIVVDGKWVAFGTGSQAGRGAIEIKTSPDGLVWKDVGTLGSGVPAWVESAIGTTPPNLWAPSVFRRGSVVYLYYAASTFGVNQSAIGLTTNDRFDSLKPAEGWVDRGPLLTSTTTDDYNAIDAARVDTPDGRAWLAFGSFWSGIKMRELDPETGMLKAENGALLSVASRGGGPIEAPSILHHGDYFYLFVSFDRCCAGTASTYKIKVRADKVTGPYNDRDGIPMMTSGGTVLQKSSGRFVGPGGQEVFMAGAQEMLVYHYYDRKAGGRPMLQIAPLHFDEAGWPILDPLPSD